MTRSLPLSTLRRALLPASATSAFLETCSHKPVVVTTKWPGTSPQHETLAWRSRVRLIVLDYLFCHNKNLIFYCTCQCVSKNKTKIMVNILTVFLHLPLIEKLYPKSVELLFFDLPVMSWHIIREKSTIISHIILPNLICLWWNRYTNLWDTP